MQTNEPITLSRDVEAAVIPVGTKVTLQKGEQAYITQSLGGSYTVIVNGNMFRIEGANADALGVEKAAATPQKTSAPANPEQLEKHVWDAMKTCYDPEIPVNIVDLGLIYDCKLTPIGEASNKADIKGNVFLKVRNFDTSIHFGNLRGNESLAIVGIHTGSVAEVVCEPDL